MLYSLLFAGLKTLQAPPVVFVVMLIFPMLIGLGQAMLFRGEHPREASLLVGSCCCLIAVTIAAMVQFCSGESHNDPGLLILAILAPGLGAAVGYIFGCTIGGLFLVGKWIDERATKRSE